MQGLHPARPRSRPCARRCSPDRSSRRAGKVGNRPTRRSIPPARAIHHARRRSAQAHYNLIARRFLATLMGARDHRERKLSIDVAGEPFAASGDVLVERGSARRTHATLKRDERLPALAQGRCHRRALASSSGQSRPSRLRATARASSSRRWRSAAWAPSPPARGIIERLYTVRATSRATDRAQPARHRHHRRALAVRPRITTPEMTRGARGHDARGGGCHTQEHVVDHSRTLLAGCSTRSSAQRTSRRGHLRMPSPPTRVGAC